MNGRRVAVLALVLIVLSMSCARGQVPELPEPGLPDIAMVTVLNGQVVIIYNPVLCERMGLLTCRFFRAHEYGHVVHGHVLRAVWPQWAEFEADCFAARYAALAEFEAAYSFFQNGNGGTPVHGTGPERAARIYECRYGP